MPSSYIKKIKQTLTGDIIYPVSKTQAIYLPDNVTTLNSLLGDSDISSIGNGTITGALSFLSSAKLTIPTLNSFSGDISAGNSGWTENRNIATVDKTGFAIGVYYISFPFNATGRRAAQLTQGTSNISMSYATGMAVTQSDPTRFIVPFMMNVTQGQTLGLRVWQNSGGELTVNYMLRFFVIS